MFITAAYESQFLSPCTLPSDPLRIITITLIINHLHAQRSMVEQNMAVIFIKMQYVLYGNYGQTSTVYKTYVGARTLDNDKNAIRTMNNK